MRFWHSHTHGYLTASAAELEHASGGVDAFDLRAARARALGRALVDAARRRRSCVLLGL